MHSFTKNLTYLFYVAILFVVCFFMFRNKQNVDLVQMPSLLHSGIEDEKFVSLQTDVSRFDICLSGGGVKDILIVENTKDLMGSGVDVNSELSNEKLVKSSEKIAASHSGKPSLVSDSKTYVHTMRPTRGISSNALATQSLQIISNDQSVTFGKYSVVKLTKTEVWLELKHKKGTIQKQFILKDGFKTSISCNVRVIGFEGEELFMSTGAAALNPIMGRQYDDLRMGMPDVNNTLSQEYKVLSLPKQGSSKSILGQVSWLSNRCGMYTMLLDVDNPMITRNINVFAISSKESIDVNKSGIKQNDAFYIAAVTLDKNGDNFRITAAPCSELFLSHLEKISENRSIYTDIEKVSNIFGFVVNPIIFCMRFVFLMVKNISGNWAAGFIGLMLLFILLTIPVNRLAKKYSARVSKHINLIHDLKNRKHSGIISNENYNAEVLKSASENKWNILVSILMPILKVLLIISMGTFFKFAYEFKGIALVPGWIVDLSAPETLFAFYGFNIRILPILVGMSSTFRVPKNSLDIHPILVYVGLPLAITYAVYDFPAGFHIYFTVSSLIIGGGNVSKETNEKVH